MKYSDFTQYSSLTPSDPHYYLRNAVLADSQFYRAPAALKHHHAYTGGLAVHTKEVLDYGLAIGAQFPAFNRDIFITAALWHDYSKTVEYVEALVSHSRVSGFVTYTKQVEEWTRATTYEATQGHILTGAQWCYHHATRLGVPADLRDAVIHCILSHHGRKDWGSPVEPATLEALVLHHADMCSANYGATKEVAP